jgi:FkbM family methyltransferase
MKWIVGSSVHSCWIGTYELELQKVIQVFIKPGMTVLDIGANAGFYTLAFSRLVGEKGQVWAFEPFAENMQNLLRHLRINQLRNVTLVQAAIASEPGLGFFRVSADKHTGSIAKEGQYRVPTLSLDKLMDQKAFPAPDLIKMDVEGAESSILEGAQKLLSTKKSVLFISLHGEQQMKRCQQMLLSAGYRIFRLNGSELSEKPFKENEIYAIPG